MAKLKSLRLKDKVFVFTSYGNAAEENPAKIVFNRFPTGGETFAQIDRKEIFNGVDIANIAEKEAQSKAVENMVNNYIDNLMAGRIDYRLLFDECIDHFEDFEYDQSKVITANDFWQILPTDAAETIAREAYGYAMKKDEFTMGE